MSKPTLPNLYFDILDGNLGMLPASPAGVYGVIGTAAAGTDNQVVSITEAKAAATAFTSGRLVNAIRDAFMNGARKVFAIKAAEEAAGSFGAVTEDKTGNGDMVPSGSPVDDYDVVVKIIQAGAFNEATFKYSLAGLAGPWSAEITVPADGQYAILVEAESIGITLGFIEGDPAADSFKVGDLYRFITYAPVTSISKLADAVAALLATPYTFEWIHIAGPTDSAVWLALDALAENAATNLYKFFHFICEARAKTELETMDEFINDLVADAAGFSGKRVWVMGHDLAIIDLASGAEVERNGAGIYAGRLAKCKVHQSAAEVAMSALLGVAGLPDGLTPAHISNLSEAGFVTCREYEGLGGVYITRDIGMAGATSDYKYAYLRRIMDKACRLVRASGLQKLHADGDEVGLSALKAACQKPLDIMVGGKECSAAVVEIPAGQDIFATEEAAAEVWLKPKPKMPWIKITIGFTTSI